MRFDQWLKQAVERLRAGESPKRDAEILLGFVAGKSRSSILAFGETELTPEQVQQLEQLLARRERGEPIAYLIGEREFWSLPLEVSPATLIPRPDTECLVEKALALLPVAACSVLDLGTGTGAIALALASERPDCQFVGVDYSADATALASRNASRLNLANATFVTGSWYEPVGAQQFALIASNPPYIDESDPHLSQGDVRFEPASALVAPENGLADLRHIVEYAPDHLIEGGWLVMEHGWQQGEAVRQLLKARGFTGVVTQKDYGNNDRITLGQWHAYSPQHASTSRSTP